MSGSWQLFYGQSGGGLDARSGGACGNETVVFEPGLMTLGKGDNVIFFCDRGQSGQGFQA